jgi:hypothetical protein
MGPLQALQRRDAGRDFARPQALGEAMTAGLDRLLAGATAAAFGWLIAAVVFVLLGVLAHLALRLLLFGWGLA